MVESTKKTDVYMMRWVSHLDWRFLSLLIPTFSLLVFLSLSLTPVNPFSWFGHLRSVTLNHTFTVDFQPNRTESAWNDELKRSRMAVCLVGGARRFELTGPSIVKMILKVYPNADLFLHSPMDKNAFKLSLLKVAPRLASIRIFVPKPIPETEAHARVLTVVGSPSGLQGLLQYFNLVEGCLTLIKTYQTQKNFTYDWVVRTRVDGYWNAPLDPSNFVPGHYLVPLESTYGGLNDRLGIGDLNTSTVALSRLSILPKLDSLGFRNLNSEITFKTQLTTQHIPFLAKSVPFCVLTIREFVFPPPKWGVPVAAISSPGTLSGAYCWPCKPVCEGACAENVMLSFEKGWSQIDLGNGTLQLCNARGGWGQGWEMGFDRVAGEELAAERKRVMALKMEECVDDFNEMKRKVSGVWDSPSPAEICKLGLGNT
ncbi:hypothetical protein CFOL_v3_20289 [Cephalotus follicularis]|uniref:DUF7796 domain-containing protein n=1 Tax=Cephalotus follicularis TaxID=3775 RepID=A0A1Q3C994_CEPFO|nr:hypothetical protein CFOL_v3_20289 [Cephalotus follicularis]